MNAVEDEPRLTLAACEGSTEAFEALVTYYEPRIRRIIYAMTHDIYLTQDLCQETFLAAFRALPRMQGKDLRFAPWLYQIALNQVRSEWRKRKHVTILPFSAPVGSNELFEEPFEEYVVNEVPFEERVVERDMVQRVLAQLPPTSALCLLLDAEGFSYKEIAEMLQESLSAVRSRLSRARQAFQRLYSGLDQEGKR